MQMTDVRLVNAAEALDAMIASGTVSTQDAMKALPSIQKVATASGAESVDIARIVTSGLKQGFFTAEQVPDILDMAVVAGQQGSFELKDMARWLPQLMASASGMKGVEGFRTILAASQSAMATASEPGGKWIERECRKILKAQGLLPKSTRPDPASVNNLMAQRVKDVPCACGGALKQTRSGSMVAQCPSCGNRYRLLARKKRAES